MKMQNENFKDEFFKRLLRFSIETINFCEILRKERNLVVIANQLIRSATSIGANVVEAKSSSSKKEYIRYFEIALKSANETKYWLILSGECCSDHQEQIKKLLNEAIEISRILGAGILTMKGRR